MQAAPHTARGRGPTPDDDAAQYREQQRLKAQAPRKKEVKSYEELLATQMRERAARRLRAQEGGGGGQAWGDGSAVTRSSHSEMTNLIRRFVACAADPRLTDTAQSISRKVMARYDYFLEVPGAMGGGSRSIRPGTGKSQRY